MKPNNELHPDTDKLIDDFAPPVLTDEQREEIAGACWSNGYARIDLIHAYVDQKVREAVAAEHKNHKDLIRAILATAEGRYPAGKIPLAYLVGALLPQDIVILPKGTNR